ncbi:MAG: hypothetical protein AAFV19_19540 [Pseudomonadota bacterium]
MCLFAYHATVNGAPDYLAAHTGTLAEARWIGFGSGTGRPAWVSATPFSV